MANAKARALCEGRGVPEQCNLAVGRQFCRIASDLGACRRGTADGDPSELSHIALARRMYAERLSRSQVAGADVLCEHAWNMLLDLFISREEGRLLDVTSLTIGSGAPSTTALRWIQALERRELIGRTADSKDRRRSFVELTPAGLDLMGQYFDTVGRLDT